tara:strand:+ start:162 stop:599 length:438 start_codon:yes stop_codon:yes gene_type:complete
MRKIIPILLLFVLSCGAQYVQDPNAFVLVTSKYENEKERIIIPNENDCRPQLDCNNKTEAECIISLYGASGKCIEEGEILANKELYLSASLEYGLALTRLSEAEIRLKRIEDFDQWKVVTDLGLEQKIKERVKLCERKIFLFRWK